MRRPRLPAFARWAALALSLCASGAAAQQQRDAERRLESVQRELREVAAERREIEGERGEAHRALRSADEKVARSSRALHEVEVQLADEEASLASLRTRRDAMQLALVDQREELARLLRAAYAQGGDAPLKVLLAQDSVAQAQRLLTYHRYLQQDRADRIRALAAELEDLDAIERDIAARQLELEASKARLATGLAELEADRDARRSLVADLDARFDDRRSRERALGRDARGLEQLLARLREAARRAEAERRRAAEAEARRAAAAPAADAPAAPAPRLAATALGGPQVGGTGWPLTGNLMAGYRARMPDGRSSDGLLLAAEAGTPVKAVADGNVVYAGWMTGYGMLLIVDHGGGYMSLYAHNDAVLKDVGDAVQRGEAVATVGSSGGHGRPALYFELRRDGKPVDPGVWLRR